MFFLKFERDLSVLNITLSLVLIIVALLCFYSAFSLSLLCNHTFPKKPKTMYTNFFILSFCVIISPIILSPTSAQCVVVFFFFFVILKFCNRYPMKMLFCRRSKRKIQLTIIYQHEQKSMC